MSSQPVIICLTKLIRGRQARVSSFFFFHQYFTAGRILRAKSLVWLSGDVILLEGDETKARGIATKLSKKSTRGYGDEFLSRAV